MYFYPLCSCDRLPETLEKLAGELLFQQTKIAEVLGGSGYNTERLATPYIPQFTGREREKGDRFLFKKSEKEDCERKMDLFYL